MNKLPHVFLNIFTNSNFFYFRNPSEHNIRVYYELEKAINCPNTDGLDENTKNVVIWARMEKDRQLADSKRKILQELSTEPLPVINKSIQLLAEMSVSYLEPSQSFRNQPR